MAGGCEFRKLSPSCRWFETWVVAGTSPTVVSAVCCSLRVALLKYARSGKRCRGGTTLKLDEREKEHLLKKQSVDGTESRTASLEMKHMQGNRRTEDIEKQTRSLRGRLRETDAPEGSWAESKNMCATLEAVGLTESSDMYRERQWLLSNQRCSTQRIDKQNEKAARLGRRFRATNNRALPKQLQHRQRSGSTQKGREQRPRPCWCSEPHMPRITVKKPFRAEQLSKRYFRCCGWKMVTEP